MLKNMRALVIQGMQTGKIVAFNMCKSPANFDTEFKDACFPAETIFDYGKIRRTIDDWLTPEELEAYKAFTKTDKVEVKSGFMIVIIFKSENEDDLINGLQGIPGVEDFQTTVVHRPLI